MDEFALKRISKAWRMIEPVGLLDLIDARLQLHHAIQIVAGVGRYLVPPSPDDSNTSMSWSHRHQALIGFPVGKNPSLRVGLRPADITILLIAEDEKILNELHLVELTIGEASSWIEDRLEDFGINADAYSIKMPYELPEHPAEDGQPFVFDDPQIYDHISRFWNNADLMLQSITDKTDKASPIRCWPHHFDIATLITLEEHEDPDLAKTIGVGLSPGDEYYTLPYFYVTPWPHPENSLEAPFLQSGGHWHSDEWFGAVLTANHINKCESAAQQIEQVNHFYWSALDYLLHQ